MAIDNSAHIFPIQFDSASKQDDVYSPLKVRIVFCCIFSIKNVFALKS